MAEHDLVLVQQRLVDQARELVGARYSTLGVLSDDGAFLSQLVTSGLSRIDRDRIGDPTTRENLLALTAPNVSAFLDIPIAGPDNGAAVLCLIGKVGAKEFDGEDERLATQLGRMAVAAMENARLGARDRQALDQARTIQREHDLFFAMMNHELRNALTGVFGWAERLVRLRPAPAAAMQAALETFECAEGSIKLLNNLLDLMRLDAGKVRPVWRDVNLRGAVDRVLGHQRPIADAKRLVLEEQCDDGLSDLRTDPVRLVQILTNLLSNAIRHSPEGATVTIKITQALEGVSFRVIDCGPGIPRGVQQRIFEPFERGDPLAGIGAGLGLPVSRRLAEVLGGRLTVESEVNRGATFELVLPPGPNGG